MCDHQFVQTGWSLVCVKCGIEKPVVEIDTYNEHSAPLVRHYDRENRFVTKIDRLLGRIFPKRTDPVWNYLETQTCKNPTEIRLALRKSKIQCKHYDCVSTFTRVFTKFRPEPFDEYVTREYLIKTFQNLHDKWSSCCADEPSFFSYDWLIRVFLEQIKSPLIVYLKPATSKRRHDKYTALLKRVQDDDRTCCRKNATIHFQNELLQTDCHLC